MSRSHCRRLAGVQYSVKFSLGIFRKRRRQPATDTPGVGAAEPSASAQTPASGPSLRPSQSGVAEPVPPGQKAANWRVVAASITGTSHDKNQQPCQDAHQWRLLPNGSLVAGVADGAGSAKHAEIGSARAVAAVVETLEQRSANLPAVDKDDEWRSLLADVLKAALAAVEKEASTRGVPVRDLATTLIVLVATPTLVAAAQIGDGAALVKDAAGGLVSLTRPSRGEYANETTFLVSPNAIETAQLNVWKGQATGLAAFSDGLQMVALNMQTGAPHAPFFSPLFGFVKSAPNLEEAKNQLQAFLQSPRISQRTDDDLTLLLAVVPE